MVDRLLASPRYGEQWGRHWLDLAGYADSEGILDADYVRTAAWRYRDYVIRAFNTDKPYDRFLKEQIAGDELTDYWTAYHTKKELPPEVIEGVVATGFLRCACDCSRPDFAQIKNAPGYYYQTLDDTLKIVASSTLGLTVQCARCHSHKYDPIPQAEYYRMQAIFMSAYRPNQWVPQVQRRLLEGSEAQVKEADAANAKVDAAVAELKKQADGLTKEYADRLFADRLAALPEAIREDVRTALAADPAKRDAVQNYLAGKFQKELRPDPRNADAASAQNVSRLRHEERGAAESIKAEQAKRVALPEIRALYDLPGEPHTPLLRRGDYLNPGQEAQPGVLTVLDVGKPFDWKPPAAGRPQQRPTPGVCGMADAARSPADRPRDDESPLALPFWRGDRRYAGQFRSHRLAAEPPGIAGLAGDRVRGPRLVDQGDAPPHRHVERLPASRPSPPRRRTRRRSTRTTVCCGGSGCAGWTESRCATASWPFRDR